MLKVISKGMLTGNGECFWLRFQARYYEVES
jgi:hypothetical protein